MEIYQKIYKQHYGPVPKEANGRSYEIHHIDGNHANNNPTNLKAVTLQEHYDIHFTQGDWGACYLMGGRMKMSPEVLSELNRKEQYKRIANGTHNFLDSDFQRQNQLKRLREGTHNFQDPELRKRVIEILKRPHTPDHKKKVSETLKKSYQSGKRKSWNKGATQENDERLAKFAVKMQKTMKGRRPANSLRIHTCPHCGKTGQGPAMFRHHFDGCKSARKLDCVAN